MIFTPARSVCRISHGECLRNLMKEDRCCVICSSFINVLLWCRSSARCRRICLLYIYENPSSYRIILARIVQQVQFQRSLFWSERVTCIFQHLKQKLRHESRSTQIAGSFAMWWHYFATSDDIILQHLITSFCVDLDLYLLWILISWTDK